MVVMNNIQKKFKLNKMRSLEVFARKRTLLEFDLYGDELTPRFQPYLKQACNSSVDLSNKKVVDSPSKTTAM